MIARPGLWWAICFLAVVVAACRADDSETAGRGDARQLAAAVDSLLTESARSWNAGDLDGFLRWYERSPETSYIGASGLLRGWDAIRVRYVPLFEPGASRDSLRFEGLETRLLAPDLGLATARYVLFQGDVTTATGVFTLVLKRSPEGWRIVHDHSSATPP